MQAGPRSVAVLKSNCAEPTARRGFVESNAHGWPTPVVGTAVIGESHENAQGCATRCGDSIVGGCTRLRVRRLWSKPPSRPLGSMRLGRSKSSLVPESYRPHCRAYARRDATLLPVSGLTFRVGVRTALQLIIPRRRALVPRTRSSHHIAARVFANFGFKSGTRIIDFASVPLIPRFASSVPQAGANLGIGTLVWQIAGGHLTDHRTPSVQHVLTASG